MSNYSVITDWDGKDALADSNPAKIISGDEFQDEFDAIATAISTKADTGDFQAVYPVGSIYMNASNATNPGTLFGFGTWVAFGEGRMLLGESSSYSAGSTGGSKDAIVVSHTHSFSGTTATGGSHSHNYAGGEYSGSYDYGTNMSVNNLGEATDGRTKNYDTSTHNGHTHSFSGTTASSGSSGTDKNMPPYIVVYMWKRTA